MMLSEDFLERVKDANPIHDVMSRYAQLKRAGRLYKCLCPFHSERTPSCTVYPDTQSFYCFGCGAGGDVITFVSRISNLSYIESVRMLAENSGISMPEDLSRGDGFSQRRQRIYEANKAAARFFYAALKTPQGKAGLEYLLGRGLSPETIKHFGLGYADDHWTTLRDHLLAEGFSQSELEDASLISAGKSGNYFDFFKNRVMFPFFDLRGNIIAFGGRTLSADDPRKYLNSRETPVYQKNKFLFALNFAKNTAAKEKRLILCEGNMDVISLHQAGFETAVATCGTAITPEHARLMLQYADEVVLCFDADTAGQKATQKAVGILGDVGLRTRIVTVSDAKDPDEYIRKFGTPHFRNLIDKSEGATTFALKNCEQGLDMGTDLGKIEFLKRAFAVISELHSKVERDVYISRLAENYQINRTTAEAEVAALIKKRMSAQSKKDWQRTATFSAAGQPAQLADGLRNPKLARAQKGLLHYLFRNPDKHIELAQKLTPDCFPTEIYQKIYISLLEKLKSTGNISISAFGGEFSAAEMGKISEIINLNREIPITAEVAADYIRILLDEREKASPAGGEIDLEALRSKLRSKLK
ncbi:MAG: DNA primase [Oscillospiraceae bacterium]